MYNVMLGLQIFAVLLGLFCIVMLLIQKNTNIAKYMLITCICSFVQNAGYLLELTSHNIYEAMMAIRFEYIGGAFLTSCVTIFVFKYCKKDLNKFIKIFLLGFGTIVLASVWLYEINPLYYTSVDWVETGVIHHVLLGKGPLYILNSVLTFAQIVLCIAYTIVIAVQMRDSKMKARYRFLMFSCTIPLIFYVIGMSGITQGYDPIPLGGAIGVLSFVLVIAFRNAFNLVEMAHETVLANLNEAVVILDYTNGFQEANSMAYELFPELRKSIRGKGVKSDVLNDIIEEKGGVNIPIRGKYYDATFSEVVSNKMLIGYAIVFTDITEEKTQRDTVQKLRNAAEVANQAKSSFLASVSHEIRTPINVIVGMSDVITRDSTDSRMKGYAANIQEAANSLLDLINDILDFSKIESGKTALVCGDYETKRFFYDVINTYHNMGNEKGLRFETDIKSNIPATLYGDEARIRQIIINLLSNAFKYTYEGYVQFRADFEWTGSLTGNLILSVSDSGIGINKEDVDKMFVVFAQLEETINRAIEGAGLGLNITKQLVNLMNGSITVDSEHGKGSTFTVTIPQEIHGDIKEQMGNLSEYKPQKRERKAVGYTAPEAKILIIDDTKTNLIVAKALLRDTKVQITTGISGYECIEKVKNEHYDVIFLDHRMPEMNGIETLHNMENIDHKCINSPVIMLTANASNDARDYYIGEGFTDFISKPISEESITKMLRQYLPKDKIIVNE